MVNTKPYEPDALSPELSATFDAINQIDPTRIDLMDPCDILISMEAEFDMDGSLL